MSDARHLIEAETPKKALNRVRGAGGLDQWLKENFIRKGDRFVNLQPFACAPAFQGLSGRFWIYMLQGETFGPWEFSCVLLGEGQLYTRTALSMHPLEPIQREVRSILSTAMNEVKRAAQNPPQGDYRELREWLAHEMREAFKHAKRTYQQLESTHEGLWAT